MVGVRQEQGRVPCQESGRISWSNASYDFLHIRFDGCVCNDSTVSKCDCIIFRFGRNEKPIMFVIETKGNDPSFSEVKKQIEFCIESMMVLLPTPKTQFRVIPVLCAARITSFIKEASLSNKVKIFGGKTPIHLCRYNDNINDLG